MSAQNPGVGWFYGRWQKAVNRLDKDKISRSVRELAEAHPDESPERLARRIARQTARGTAAVGVISAGPALIPGVGFAVSLIGLIPEEIYLIRRKCAMVLQIAAVYGFDPAAEERLYEVIALVNDLPGHIPELMTAKDDINRIATRAIAGMGRTASRRMGLGAKAMSRGVVRRLPAVGLVAGGAINYYAFRVLGRRTMRFYRELREGRTDPELLTE